MGAIAGPPLLLLSSRQAESPEHVEPDHCPAEGAEVVVDLVHEPAIAPATIGRAGPAGGAPLGSTAIEDDLDGGIARKRALGVLEELLPIARDDQDLLRRLLVGVIAALRLRRPALGEGMELGQDLERPLVEKLGEKDPGISATRGA